MRIPTRRGIAVALLLLPCCAVLLTPLYNHRDPVIFGVPFFYVYQLAWVPLSALCIMLAGMLAPSDRDA